MVVLRGSVGGWFEVATLLVMSNVDWMFPDPLPLSKQFTLFHLKDCDQQERSGAIRPAKTTAVEVRGQWLMLSPYQSPSF